MATGPDVVVSLNRGPQLFATSVAMVVLAGIFVVSRLAIRGWTRKFGWDDYTIGASLVFSIALTTAISVDKGYGQHREDLTERALEAASKWYYIAQVVYKAEICLTKVSIICCYLRVFPGRNIERLGYGLLVIVVPWSLGSIVATVLQCIPPAASWDKFIKKAHCINSNAFWEAYGVINILTDVAILVLPVRDIAKLQMRLRDKAGLLVAFMLGAFVTVTSIIRVIAVTSSETNKQDFTWAFVPRSTWTLIEANTGIVCACLPILRKPVFDFFPCTTRKRVSSGATSDSRYFTNDSSPGSQPLSQHWLGSEDVTNQSVLAGKGGWRTYGRDSGEEEIMQRQLEGNTQGGTVRMIGIKVPSHLDDVERRSL
ncbi:hypothetical protein B0A49_09467 [Cryomyces minteri]|uniref:Rhodopsin domain-containing protein n=1 Tax=Cryomyces minteri TaxID=331657 RepID=A0A4U0WJL2_9PEZI|nr:hypothetical protein B0A49_09467 [Cryomyces minteri]